VIVKPLEWLLRLRRGDKKPAASPNKAAAPASAKGTFIQKYDPAWLKQTLSGRRFQILTWRSVNVHFLRTVIHQKLGGAFWLKFLYALEEKFPRFFGEKGQYPLIVITKE
jgi:hypothetical protein